MNFVLTGSLGNIGLPLTEVLVAKGHTVTVISSKESRKGAIEALGAKAAIGTMQDADFLTRTFAGADAVYLMEAWEGIGSMMDKDVDFPAAFRQIGQTYKTAVERAGIKNIVHLSSIGADTGTGNGSLSVHHAVENILGELPSEVAIKYIRPVGFFTNILRFLPAIKAMGAIVQAYGGDAKEPWVSPADIADAIAEALETPFAGRTVQYVASEEASPNEIATLVGNAIGKPHLQWMVVPAEQMLQGMLGMGMNPWIAAGFIEMQAAQASGKLYEHYNLHKPAFGKRTLADFAPEITKAYNS